MEEFAAKHSPGLWETLLKALTGDRGALTSERADLQKRRIVALLHILAYFRSQKTSHFQKTSGLHASVSGLSLVGLSAGQVLGFSANPRTIEKFRKELADNHPTFAAEQISKGTNVIIILPQINILA